MSKLLTARNPDYQQFSLDADGMVSGPGERMSKKLQAIPLPDLKGKTVLDIGCDFGFWTFLASNKGASRVLGLDRNRPVRGEHFDLITSNRETALQHANLKNCYFENVNVGKQWIEYGKFDVIFLFSLYHHIFENCGDHDSIWFWLFRHCTTDSVIVWENPVDVTDGVAHGNISKDKHHLYTRENILKAASGYFDIEYKGPALHEENRHVYYFRPRLEARTGNFSHIGRVEHGAGGATKAFEHDGGRRTREIAESLGINPMPGSLNMRVETPFDWGRGYYRTQISDVLTRSLGFDSPWGPRWVRFYPVKVDGWHEAFVMRFEGEENYKLDFVELIASFRLRDRIHGENVTLERP